MTLENEYLKDENLRHTPEPALAKSIDKITDPTTANLIKRYSYLSSDFTGAQALIRETEALLNLLAGKPDNWQVPIYPAITPMADVINTYMQTSPSIKGWNLEKLTAMISEIGSKRKPPIILNAPQTDEELTEYVSSGQGDQFSGQ